MKMQSYFRLAVFAIGATCMAGLPNLSAAPYNSKAKPGASTTTGQTSFERLGGMKGVDDLATIFMRDLYKPVHPAKAETAKMTSPSTAARRDVSMTTSTSSVSTSAKVESSTSARISKPMPAMTVTEAAKPAGQSEASKPMAAAQKTEKERDMMKRTENPGEVLRSHVAARICEAVGGSCPEPATSVADIHGKIHVTDAQWTQALNGLRSTLDERKVSPGDRDKIVDGLMALKREVSISSAPSAR